MARNSKGRSGQKKKTSTSSKSKSSKTSTQKHVECQEDEKDDIWSNDKEEELVTPKSALLHAQTKVQLKPNFTEWMNSIREKHPVSKMGNIQEDIRPIVLDETVTMQEGMIEDNNVDKQGDDLVHISMEDIQPEVDYWKPSIVSFVIGANPPGKAMEGFFRRVWKEHGVDKVITIKRVVLKPWHLDIDVTRDEIKRIPIWVHMELNFKYWGAKCLEKIVKPVGTLIKVDNVTAQREKLHCARCMIEVEINQKFPMAVQFLNEKNEITNVPITYEWKPEICSKCKRMGYESQQCVTATTQFKMQKKWVQKGKSDEVQNSIPTKTTSQRQSEQNSQMNHAREGRGDPYPDESCKNIQNDKLGDKGVSRERGQQPELARELLWKDLDRLNDKLDGPWMIMGDFNCVLNIDEKIGNAVRDGEMEAARYCMEACGMQDIPYSGHYYTWSNKQVASERVFTKLDRVMANDQWLEVYKGMNAIFLVEGCSDHSPALLRMNQGEGSGKKPFKYYRMWQQASDYKVRVKAAWESNIQGTAMFNLVQKMKRYKQQKG
ncbi:60 kDa chaperonin 1 [Bienertia sinuspersici]